MSIGPPSARGEGFRCHQRARSTRSASAARGHQGGWLSRISPSARTRRSETKAPAMPVDALRYATADAGSIPAVSTKAATFEPEPENDFGFGGTFFNRVARSFASKLPNSSVSSAPVTPSLLT